MKRLFLAIFGAGISLAYVAPIALEKLYGRIWSIEGFLLYGLRRKPLTGVGFLLILLGTLVLWLLTVSLIFRSIQKGEQLLKNKKLRITVGAWSATIPVFEICSSVLVVVLFCGAIISVVCAPSKIPLSMRWFEKYTLVAHGGGGVEGQIGVTNSTSI